MHASLHQLLALRDQVIADSAVIAHVNDCAECRTELERLRSVTAELRNLPSQLTPPDRWSAIQSTLASAPRKIKEPKHPGWSWPVAAAAAVVLTVLVLNWKGDGVYDRVITDASQPEQIHEADSAHQSLVAQSRELEQLLSELPQEPAVVRASTALTLADLHDRIRWVDYRLAHSEEAGLEPDQSQLLWRERVDLLNSLVAVRYAQTRTSF